MCPVSFRLRLLLVRVSAGLLVSPESHSSLVLIYSSSRSLIQAWCRKKVRLRLRFPHLRTAKIIMLRIIQQGSSRMTMTYFCALVILFLELSHSVHGLPVQARATSKICGANLRPRGLRGLCEQGKSVWHFDSNGKFTKMTLDKQTKRGDVQCGKSSRAPWRRK